MVLGGSPSGYFYNMEGFYKKATILNDPECILKDLPQGSYHNSGAMLGNDPSYCGWRSARGGINKECFKLKNGTWTQITKMKYAREYHHAVSVTDEMVWMTGGSYSNKAQKTTEILFVNGSIKHGPNLPKRLENHCSLKVDTGHIYIKGRQNGGGGSKETLIFQSNLTFSHQGPSLRDIRYDHGCNSIYSQNMMVLPLVESGESTQFIQKLLIIEDK
jgi:hypothetical protein